MLIYFCNKNIPTILYIFSVPTDIYIEKIITMEQKKRQFRELSDETKEKISNSTRDRAKSAQHKQNISQGMIKYWETIPNKPQPSSGETPI